MSGFWEGGYDAYCEALEAAREVEIRALEASLARAMSDDQRDRLRQQLREVRAAFAARLRQAARCLF
jgi:hypothetical protein